jgi:SCY1-like protein 2
LKSFSSNINSNYTVAASPSSTSGPWKIYDAKKKSTGKAASVFVFDRKSLDSHGASLGRSSASSVKRATEEVVERLKKEASSLVRLLITFVPGGVTLLGQAKVTLIGEI